MRKLLMSTYKEILLLLRDMGGLVILFIMPLALIITITLIQDSSFKKITNVKIPILFVDNDKGDLSKAIFESMNEDNSFEIVTQIENAAITEEIAKKAVLKGDYQLAVVFPENVSRDLQKMVSQNVSKVLSEFGVEEDTTAINNEVIPTKEIKLYFDPAVQKTFKNAVLSNIDKLISKIESKSIYKAFQDELSEDGVVENSLLEENNFISFKEINPKEGVEEIMPNSTQHNVPAWTLFAIFFIVIPLSINIVKEKSQGTFVRLRTNPVSYVTVLGGKVITYLTVSILQFLLMLAVGVYLLPYMGLNALEIGSSFMTLFIVALFSGLAAIGFGILLGTLATTPEQSAPFGATSVVILAAIGGVWVPVFLMPNFMQLLSNLSPMNWALSAFYDVFLRQAGIIEILPEISLLFAFFIAMVSISIIYDRNKRAI